MGQVLANRSIGKLRRKSQQSSNPGKFFSLPLELRRIIYRHLLIPSPIVTVKRKTYGIEPAILLTNKQIYEEASWVLYRDNDWVLLSVNAPIQTFLEGWHIADALQRYPIIPLAENSFSRVPCLEINIRSMGANVQGTARVNLKRFMVSLDGLPRVCHILTAARNRSELEMVAQFAEGKASVLDGIMNCLEEVCGYGSVVVEGLDAAATQKAVNKLMIPEGTTQEQIVNRIVRHGAWIQECTADGGYIQATKAYQDEMAYIEFVCKSADNQRFDPPFPMLPLHLLFSKIALSHASCCIMYHDYQSARQIMSLFLGSNPHTSVYRGTPYMLSKGHFVYGMSLWADGANNAAAFSFFRALALIHSDKDVDMALDAMEAGLAPHDSGTETLRLRQNLQSFKSWRHRKVQDLRVRRLEHAYLLRELLLKFLMSDDERRAITTRKDAYFENRGHEVFMDALDSLPSRDSAFIFGGGVRVL